MQAQSNLEIIFRKIPNSNRQKPPINKRTIKTLPWALANKERARATNHIKRASFRIIFQESLFQDRYLEPRRGLYAARFGKIVGIGALAGVLSHTQPGAGCATCVSK